MKCFWCVYTRGGLRPRASTGGAGGNPPEPVLYSRRGPQADGFFVTMIAKDIQSAVEQLGEMIADASTIVPFTGAGISTECGIPDFRSPGGLWTRNRPIAFDEFVASQDARDEVLAPPLCDGADLCRGEAGPRPPRARLALSRRQDAGDHHPEHRQSASGVGLLARPRHRAARQHDLCPLHRLRPRLRSCRG